MRILITDENMIWTPDNPALEPYAEIVLVVCLNGKAVTDKYECFVTPYDDNQWWMGMDLYGAEDEKYASLEKAADELNRQLRYHDDIIILADNTPASLYPFAVLKNRNEWNSLHLCTLSPWSFELGAKKRAVQSMLHDLSSLSSLMYLNSEKIISELEPGAKYTDLFQRINDTYVELLPRILYQIQERDWRRAFFDFYSKSYLPIEEGYDMIEYALRHQEVDPSKIKAYKRFCTLGLIVMDEYPNDNKYTLEAVEALAPRPDGKSVCNYLRELRLQLAAANNIPFSSEDCPSVGPCTGTCAKCDREARELFKEMEKIPVEKRVYPANILEKWEGSL